MVGFLVEEHGWSNLICFAECGDSSGLAKGNCGHAVRPGMEDSICVVCAHPSASVWTAAQNSHSHKICTEPSDSSSQWQNEGGGVDGLINFGRHSNALAHATNPQTIHTLGNILKFTGTIALTVLP